MLLNSELLVSLIFTLTFIPHVMMLFCVLYRVLQRFLTVSLTVLSLSSDSLFINLFSASLLTESDSNRLQLTLVIMINHNLCFEILTDCTSFHFEILFAVSDLLLHNVAN